MLKKLYLRWKYRKFEKQFRDIFIDFDFWHWSDLV